MSQLIDATETVLTILSKARGEQQVSREEIILVCQLYLATKDAYLGMKQANEAIVESLKKFGENIQ